MLFQYRFHAPGNELHGEPFEIQSESRTAADARAAFHVSDTFSITRRPDVRAVFVAEFVSRRAFERACDESADTLPAPAESGVAMTAGDADAVIAIVLAEDLHAAGAR